jgi:hypothetical protein
MLNKIIYLNSISEYQLLSDKDKKFYTLVSKCPSLLDVDKKVICFYSILKKKDSFFFDNIDFRNRYTKLLKVLDHKINTIHNSEVFVLSNSVHQHTQFLSYSINFYLFLKCLEKKGIKEFKYFAYDLSKQEFKTELDINQRVIQKFKDKTKNIYFKKVDNLNVAVPVNLHTDLFEYSNKKKIKKKIIQWCFKIYNKFFFYKKEIALGHMSRELNIFLIKELNNYNLINVENYIKIFDFKLIKKSLFYKLCIKSFKNFKRLDIVLIYLILDYYFYVYKNLAPLFLSYKKQTNLINKRFDFKFFIGANEQPLNNLINLDLSKKKICSLTLSHGGTLGHFQRWPCVFFFNANYENSYYQAFSEKLINTLNKYKFLRNKSNKFLNLPHLYLIELQKKIFFNLNKKKSFALNRVCYVSSPNYIIHDLKKKNHSIVNLYKTRKKILDIFVKKKDTTFFIKNYLNDKFLFDESSPDIKNIKFINNKSFSDLNYEFDLIILETVSTSMLDSLSTNKKIICLNRNFPKLTEEYKRDLKKRVILCENNSIFVKEIFKAITFPSFKRYNQKILNNYYNFKNCNKFYFVKTLKKILNKNDFK